MFSPAPFQDEGKELEIASHLADKMGADVFLAPRVEQMGLNLVDAWIQGEAWEFKRVTPEATNIENAVRQRLRRGKEQSERVVVYLDSNLASDESINRGVRLALMTDLEEKLHVIAMLKRSGKLQILTRREISNEGIDFNLFSGSN